MPYFILDPKSGEPVACDWKTWEQRSDYLAVVVACEFVRDSYVSTTFLGHNTNWNPFGGPLWESRVVGGILDGDTATCKGSREQAQAMHARMVKAVQDIYDSGDYLSPDDLTGKR